MKHSNGFLNFRKLISDVLSAFKTPEKSNGFLNFCYQQGYAIFVFMVRFSYTSMMGCILYLYTSVTMFALVLI